jgi:AcrR family transcriptional regulator
MYLHLESRWLLCQEENVRKTDGRTQRRERSRARIVAATMELVEEGDLAPTAERVAERAGVSRRLVFELFRDIDTLIGEVGTQQWQRIAPLLTPISPELPLVERLERFVASRAQLYETIAPMRRAVRLREPFQTTIASVIAMFRAFKREQALELFGAELAAIPAPRRSAAQAALGACAAFDFWEMLRTQQGLSREAAAAALTAALTALLTPAGPCPSGD